MKVKMLDTSKILIARKEDDEVSDKTIERRALWHFIHGKHWSYPIYGGDIDPAFEEIASGNQEYAIQRRDDNRREYIRVLKDVYEWVIIEIGFVDAFPSWEEIYPPESVILVSDLLEEGRTARLIPTRQLRLCDRTGYAYSWLFQHFGVNAELSRVLETNPNLLMNRSIISLRVSELDYYGEKRHRVSMITILHNAEEKWLGFANIANNTPYHHIGAAFLAIVPGFKDAIYHHIQDVQRGKVEDIVPYWDTRVKYVMSGKWMHLYLEGISSSDKNWGFDYQNNFSIGSRTPRGFYSGPDMVKIPYALIPSYLEHMWHELHRDGENDCFDSRFDVKIAESTPTKKIMTPDDRFLRIMDIIQSHGHILPTIAAAEAYETAHLKKE